MRKKILIIPAVFMLCSLFSCYEKKLTQSVHYSSGTWNDSRTEFIFLRWERDYHMPKGITRFPDGGIPEYVRDERFICVYSKYTGEVKVIAEGKGGPRGLPPSARFSWKGDRAVYKIWNADKKENSLNPVVVINMKTMESKEFFSVGENPELSPDSMKIVTVKENSVWMMNIDGTGGEMIFESGEPELIFLMWNKQDEIDLHLRDQGKFMVYILDLKKRELRRSGKPYLKNFGNESTYKVLKVK